MNVDQKLLYPVVASSLFTAVSLPSVYHYTNGFFGTGRYDTCPSPLTRLIHTGVYMLLQFLLLKVFELKRPVEERTPDNKLFVWSIKGALLFSFISDPTLYELTSGVVKSLINVEIADDLGCPSLLGVGVHTIVFFFALYAIMMLNGSDK